MVVNAQVHNLYVVCFAVVTCHRRSESISSLYPTSPSFQLVWHRLCDVVLFASCLSEHTLTAVCVLREYRSGRKYNVHW